ncbi:hypothetical protein [Bacillus sp. FJAT-28004]|uniref:hypothetical protein n=1 Tax=Bacillus sp. FJAT-28004 TaxID=1679165 RepID=UPI0006B55384|nr:hypothetical protein [Bacillus sp. FJAT-28004]
MKIIEFIMNNIFIVVVILGALASFFGKSGAKKKPGQMPDFGGGGLPRTLFPGTGEHERESERPQPQQAAGSTVYRTTSEQERSTEMNPSYSSRETAGPPQIAPLQRVLQRAATSKDAAQTAAERNYGSQSINAASIRSDDLRKAVIWSEVLGPPRSKRPFRK